MSKKFFSLIHGDTLHVAPNTKVIPKDAISSTLNAIEMIEKVEEDIKQYRVEVEKECDILKEKATKKGFEKGYQDWVEKIADLENEIIKVRQDSEAIIVPIALKAAKKIVGKELSVSKSAVVDIIANSLKAVSSHKKIKIFVNPKELEVAEKNREELKKVFENLETLSIAPQDDIIAGGCIIETERGIINAQLDNQWLILENAFQKLMSTHRPIVEKDL